MRQEERDKAEVQDVLARVEFLRQAGNRSEALTEGVKSPFWTDYLLPVLNASIDSFEKGVWTMAPGEFEARRAAAAALLDFKDFVLARVGTKEEIEARANALLDSLQRSVTSGRIPADWLEEAGP